MWGASTLNLVDPGFALFTSVLGSVALGMMIVPFIVALLPTRWVDVRHSTQTLLELPHSVAPGFFAEYVTTGKQPSFVFFLKNGDGSIQPNDVPASRTTLEVGEPAVFITRELRFAHWACYLIGTAPVGSHKLRYVLRIPQHGLKKT